MSSRRVCVQSRLHGEEPARGMPIAARAAQQLEALEALSSAAEAAAAAGADSGGCCWAWRIAMRPAACAAAAASATASAHASGSRMVMGGCVAASGRKRRIALGAASG